MVEPVKLRNRHPVDELADVREQIKQLEYRADELRTVIIASRPAARVGEEWSATVVHQQKEMLDKRAIIEQFGRERLASCFKLSEFDVVTLKRKK